MTSRYSAAIFDMDGTLLDSMGAWRSLGRNYLAERGIELPAELADWRRTSTRLAAEAIARLLPGGLVAEEIFHVLVKRMPDLYRDVLPKPGAIEWLDALNARGIPCCVATASPFAREVLNRLGIAEKLCFIADEHDIGFRKHEPSFFVEVACRMGPPPSECVVFEDALYAVHAAKLAGCQVIAVEDEYALDQRDQIMAEADRYITSYHELLSE